MSPNEPARRSGAGRAGRTLFLKLAQRLSATSAWGERPTGADRDCHPPATTRRVGRERRSSRRPRRRMPRGAEAGSAGHGHRHRLAAITRLSFAPSPRNAESARRVLYGCPGPLPAVIGVHPHVRVERGPLEPGAPWPFPRHRRRPSRQPPLQPSAGPRPRPPPSRGSRSRSAPTRRCWRGGDSDRGRGHRAGGSSRSARSGNPWQTMYRAYEYGCPLRSSASQYLWL